MALGMAPGCATRTTSGCHITLRVRSGKFKLTKFIVVKLTWYIFWMITLQSVTVLMMITPEC
jgi:hypothetical protein